MTILNFIVLIFSSMFALAGFLIPVDSLLMMASENGELFTPVSSGSEDPFAIKLALASYSVCFLYVSFSLFVKKGLQYITGVYLANSVFYMFCMYLVSLDSNILEAAKLGNWVPLFINVVWIGTVLVVILTSFKKLSRRSA
ncbi:hypothetical protein D8T45_23935 [Vibrio vulnificus]|uniref:hypothetical protein n=1 Tax=Vibrio cholerae TaxID=666 RepID=UPI000E0B8CC0|nr:hypothetical protein [Vibrio cholerae]RZP53937.1 hypothetical protein D8T45_23935 [Vibrio vulnificus]RZR06991.1 hypothetical protein D8T24_23780 [Vibrio vulnificus]HAS6055606.1 hypothetical protein [Vibrio vulnificus]